MLKGCAKVGTSGGGDRVDGKEAGGNRRSDVGNEVIFTEGAEVAAMI